jgi:type I restriction enzyme M protein
VIAVDKRKLASGNGGIGPVSERDKVNLDIFRLKDESLEDSANLPAPEVIAAEITEDLETALEQFAAIAEDT